MQVQAMYLAPEHHVICVGPSVIRPLKESGCPGIATRTLPNLDPRLHQTLLEPWTAASGVFTTYLFPSVASHAQPLHRGLPILESSTCKDQLTSVQAGNAAGSTCKIKPCTLQQSAKKQLLGHLSPALSKRAGVQGSRRGRCPTWIPACIHTFRANLLWP